MIAKNFEHKPVTESIREAVIIFDDSQLAAKASAILASAADGSDDGVYWNVRLWRLDLIEGSSAAVAAPGEAADAHLMVLALLPTERPFARLREWLETWAAHRLVEDAALVLFGNASSDQFSDSAISELSEFSDRHGLTLVYDGDDTVEDESAFAVPGVDERELTLHELVQQVPEHAGNGIVRMGKSASKPGFRSEERQRKVAFG